LAKNTAYLGLDIGGSFVKYGIIDQDGSVLFSERAPTVLDRGAPSLIAVLRQAVTEMTDHCSAQNLQPGSIGIGSPGTVDARTGTVTGASPNLPGWVDVELRMPFSRFGLPVAVDNDANCSALAEFKFGAGQGHQDMIAITLGTGIGSGIVLNGKLFHGSHFSGAELGHVSIHADGPPCGCGNRGCMELYASAGAILRRAEKLARFYPGSLLTKIDFSASDDTPLAGVFQAARRKDRQAVDLLESVADDLAVGLAGVINAFDPEVLVIGGGVVDAEPGYVDLISRKTARLTFASTSRKLQMRRARLGNAAGFIGAAALGAELSPVD